MTDEVQLHLSRLHSETLSKSVFFMLAGAGAALAYGLDKLDGAALSWWLAPGLAALGCWLLSILAGCSHQSAVQEVLHFNMQLLQLRERTHPRQPSDWDLPAVIERLHRSMDAQNDAARFGFRAQYALLIAGVVMFTFWRLAEMVRNTLP